MTRRRRQRRPAEPLRSAQLDSSVSNAESIPQRCLAQLEHLTAEIINSATNVDMTGEGEGGGWRRAIVCTNDEIKEERKKERKKERGGSGTKQTNKQKNCHCLPRKTIAAPKI